MTSLRQPEYTGRNRCWACTTVNCIIAVALAAVLSALSVTLAQPLVAALGGAAVLLLSSIAIWLRGYLIPGTSTLTKRYMPARTLAWFDNATATRSGPGTVGPASSDSDTLEAQLVEAGILVHRSDDELCLSDRFTEAWRQAIDTQQSSVEVTDVVEAIGYDPAAVEIECHGDATTVSIHQTLVHKCPSTTAVQIDLASAAVLADWLATWEDIPSAERAQLLRGVRLFMNECPAGETSMLHPAIESRCGTNQVAGVVCEASGERLLEQVVRG